jgi:hypothetical protein
MSSVRVIFAAVVLAAGARADVPPLDRAYRQMYNLQFEQAHQTLQEYQRVRPDDPMGPVSEAAAYLFSEFERLHILQAEFFTDDDHFRTTKKLVPDPAVKQKFEAAIDRARQLSAQALQKSPGDKNAQFADAMRLGLHSDYLALIEKRYVAALVEMKQGRAVAEALLAKDPTFYDAYLAVGAENYILSQKPAPVRWVLHMTGSATDKAEGIAKLRLTAEKGHYLLPYARLLLAVAALRDKDLVQARGILQDLAREFPSNPLYGQQLARLH